MSCAHEVVTRREGGAGRFGPMLVWICDECGREFRPAPVGWLTRWRMRRALRRAMRDWDLGRRTDP